MEKTIRRKVGSKINRMKMSSRTNTIATICVWDLLIKFRVLESQQVLVLYNYCSQWQASLSIDDPNKAMKRSQFPLLKKRHLLIWHVLQLIFDKPFFTEFRVQIWYKCAKLFCHLDQREVSRNLLKKLMFIKTCQHLEVSRQ